MIDAERLRSFVERIGRVMDERDDLGGDIKDIYTEAKGAGMVPKVLRKVIARRRAKDPAALLADEDLFDTYMAALDGPTSKAVEMAARGATAREIEQEAGISRSTASRVVSLKKKRETKPEVRDAAPQPASEAPVPVPPEQDADALASPHAEPEGGDGAGTQLQDALFRRFNGAAHGTEPRPGNGGDASGTRSAAPPPPRDVAEGSGTPDRMHGAAMGMGDARTFDEIAGPMPAALRRARA